MDNIPLQELIKDLSYFDIINLAKTSKIYYNLLSDRQTWFYLIDRDLDPNAFPRDFIKTFVLSDKLDPREFYEFNYFAGNVKFEDMYTPIATIRYLQNFENIYDKLFLQKLRIYVDQQPIDQQTWISFEVIGSKRSTTSPRMEIDSVISGKNTAEVCLKYLTNVLSETIYRFLTNKYQRRNAGENRFSRFDIYTFNDLFDQLPSVLNIRRIDNVRHL